MNRTAEWVSFLLLWLDSPTKTDNSYKYMYMHISNCGHNWHMDFLCRKNIKLYARLFQCSNIRFNSYILRTIKLSVHWYTSLSERKRERERQTDRQRDRQKKRGRERQRQKKGYTDLQAPDTAAVVEEGPWFADFPHIMDVPHIQTVVVVYTCHLQQISDFLQSL